MIINTVITSILSINSPFDTRRVADKRGKFALKAILLPRDAVISKLVNVKNSPEKIMENK